MLKCNYKCKYSIYVFDEGHVSEFRSKLTKVIQML